MKKLMTKEIMRINPHHIPNEIKLEALKTIMSAANSRINRMKKEGFEPIKDTTKYNLNANDRFQLPKGRDSRSLDIKIREIKEFMNSPLNSLTRINKDIEKSTKIYNKEISRREYHKFRNNRGYLWRHIKHDVYTREMSSEKIDGLVLESTQRFDTFEGMNEYLQKQVDAYVAEEDQRKRLLEKQFKPRY